VAASDIVIDLAEPQRQSPLAIVLLGLRAVRSLGIVQLAVAVLFIVRGAADGRLLLVGVVVISGFVVVSVLSWWRYTFQLVDGELVVTKGVFRTDRLTVGLGRIQSIAIEQELLHRLTGLVKVVVDTAGSAQAEFTIDAVERRVAEELRRRATAASSTRGAMAHRDVATRQATSAPTDRVLFEHTPRRLVVAAFTMSPLAGLVLLVPLIAFADQALRPFRRRLSDVAPDVEVNGLGWWLAPFIALAFVTLLNLGRVFLADWQLTLRTDSDNNTLRRTSGLLSLTSTTSSVDRVQLISSRQNPLQRRVGLRDVHLSNAGTGDMRLIGCTDADFAITNTNAGLQAIAELVLDRRVHRAEVWLNVRNSTVVSATAVAVASRFVGWWSLLGFAAVPLVWWMTGRRVRNSQWSLGSELATSNRVISSSTRQAVLRKTNAVRVTQTIFERRRGLASIQLVTAAGAVTVGMIPLDEANAARDVILHAAETDRRPWM
jgi:putative membrane protein